MRVMTAFMAAAGLVATTADGAISTREAKRIEAAATAVRQIYTAPDKGIPADLWQKASCVVVIPDLKKGAFVFGGEYGKGLMSCRNRAAGEGWSAPIFMRLGKGSWGFQIGAQSIDLVLLVMNEAGAEKLLRNKVALGAEASIAAGPIGRNARAETDAQLTAEILSYSRSAGLFAGINLSGGVLQSDKDDNIDLYGAGVSPRDVVLGGKTMAPPVTRPFLAALKP
jgi:lipid-binding SYLF domain-containing protein